MTVSPPTPATPTAGATPAAPAGGLSSALRAGGSLAGVGFFLLAIFLFGIMDSMIKGASARYDTWQIMFFRGAFSLLPIALLVRQSGGAAALRSRHVVGHVLRSTMGVAAAYFFFWSYSRMPLADVYAIAFAAPLFMTALSVPVLKEQVGWRRWTAVLVGFGGVLIMLRPGQGVLGWVALMPLAGAFLYALSMLYVRILARSETNAAIVFYFIVTLTVVAGVVMIPVWRTPDLVDFALLAAIGVIGGAAQIVFTQAFRLTQPALLAPFEYTGMLWAASFGYLFFGEVPDKAIWIGGAVVVASGLYIIHRETVRSRQAA
ncbi:DMT family transporter [Oleisolibacter albus]|uniref:DMT family transporter n=1 Tax=Oleisolibacter albus TaxID=2171757 RepID=UPI000DF42F18|nr:DMT family transporter [Oleisolibacter albus]